MESPRVLIAVTACFLVVGCGSPDTPPASEVTSSPGDPTDLVVEGDSVYWVSTAGGLYQAPTAGGPAVTLADLAPGGAVAIDQRNLYAATSDGFFRVSRADQSVERLADQVSGLTTAGGFVYWSTGTSIVRAPSAGGPPETVVDEGLEYADAIAVDDQHIYWVNRLYGVLMRCDLDGEDIISLDTISGDSGPEVVLDDEYVYWGLNGYVSRVGKSDGVVTAVSDEYWLALRMWTDGDHIYTISGTSETTGAVMRFPVSGGDPVVLATVNTTNQAPPLALDDDYVYFGNNDGTSSTLQRLVK